MKIRLLLMMLCLFSFSAFAQTVADKIIAKVDNHIILKSDLEMAYMSYLSSGQKVEDNLRCQILQRLVFEKMLLARAEVDSVTVDEEQVTSQLNRRMDAIIMRANVSEDKLEKNLGKSLTELKEEMRPSIHDQLLVQKMQRTVTENVKLTPRQVKKFFSENMENKMPYFPKDYEISVLMKLPNVSKTIKEEVKMKLLDIREKVRKGEDFEKFAKATSDDLGTASRGGNLGWFGRGQLAPAYEGMCMNLKVGEIGEPVESEFGFHLIQLLDRRGNRFNSRHILIRPKPTTSDLKAAEFFLDSIRNRVMIDSLKFEKAVSLHSDDKATKMNGGYLKDYETGSVRLTHEQITDITLFKVADSMKVGNITPPMPYRTDDGKDAVRLIYLKSRGTSHEPNLKDDYERIYLMAVEDEKARQMDEWFIKHRFEVFLEIDPEYNNCKIMEMIRE